MQFRSATYQQLSVLNRQPDLSVTDWTACSQRVPLAMMRPAASTAQSINNNNNLRSFNNG